MTIRNKQEFIQSIKHLIPQTEYAIIKPNWVNFEDGEYTEPEILDWLFKAIPQKKIIIESYTPWRGSKEKLKRGLIDGEKDWLKYKKQDYDFLKESGIGKIIKKYKVEYINITDNYWKNDCVEPKNIKKYVEKKFGAIQFEENYKFIPTKLFEIKEKSVLISFAKIKTETQIKTIMASLSTKNLFGLIPYPSRQVFHGKNNELISQAISDIYKVYASLFKESIWINEGINSLVLNNCDKTQRLIKNQNLIFVNKSAYKVDSETCRYFNINPQDVPYLQNIRLN